MVKIKLLKPHRHDGIDYSAGQVVEVPQEIAEHLVKIKTAELVPSEAQ